jgi:hypothetical protein
MMGYIWTFAWISWSMRYAAAWQYEAGALSVYEPWRFSAMDLMVRRFGS